MSLAAIPDTTSVGKILRAPLKLIGPNTVVRVLRGPLRGKKWIVGSAVHSCWLGMYERAKMTRFAESLHTGDVVFDLGANVGLYSLLTAARVGPTGKVFAFEPSTRNIRFLKAHLQLNEVTTVVVIDKAVSDSTGTARFCESQSASMGHLSGEGMMEVQTLTIDDFLRSGAPAPHCVKIDVEGAEASVLVGARETLARHRPTIFAAIHSRSLHRRCIDELQMLGYGCLDIEASDSDGCEKLDKDWRAEILAVHSSRNIC